jgi:hypothetical protein
MTALFYRPILFSGPMVRALLDGRKTQTRRVMRDWVDYPHLFEFNTRVTCDRDMACWERADMRDALGGPLYVQSRCPYGFPGVRLWVRETWAVRNGPSGPQIEYRADGAHAPLPAHHDIRDEGGKVDLTRYVADRWRPSIHMPRWASRITLEVTGVRVERVQDITPGDALAEGVEPDMETHAGQYWREDAYNEFAELWNAINHARGCGWETNCWVWVVEFRRIAKGEEE